MEPWFLSAWTVDFGARIDELIRDGSGEFNDFHPLPKESTLFAITLYEEAEHCDHSC
jgi:hypothetical protein